MISRVGIIGAGVMGSGIAIALARKGIKVIVRSRHKEDKVFENIRARLLKALNKGKISEDEKDSILENIMGTTGLELVSDTDLIIESIIEDLEEKQKLFKELDKLCSSNTIFSSNTSSLKISEIASVTNRPDKFVGLHFMNPADIIPLVEVVRTSEVSEEVVKEIVLFVESIDKEPVIVEDIPGFILNHLLILTINEAINMVYNKFATPEDIDKIMQLGANHPLGPIVLADLIGLDIVLNISKNLYKFFGDKYKPSPLLEEMVSAGKLGKKTGEGFYKY